jgi:hypothetical protein
LAPCGYYDVTPFFKGNLPKNKNKNKNKNFKKNNLKNQSNPSKSSKPNLIQKIYNLLNYKSNFNQKT